MPQTDPLALVAGLEALLDMLREKTGAPFTFKHDKYTPDNDKSEYATELEVAIYDYRGRTIAAVRDFLFSASYFPRYVTGLLNVAPDLFRAIRDLAGENERLRAGLEKVANSDWVSGGGTVGGNDELTGTICGLNVGDFYKGYNAGREVQFEKTQKIVKAALAERGRE